jgi:hypothetical protein
VRQTRPSADSPQDRAARRWWPILIPLVAAVVGVTLIFPATRHQWALSIIRQPARYTVLSFNDASDLPAAAVINQPIAFSFNIGNQEGRAVNYKYVITESSGKTSRVLDEAARSVVAGETWKVAKVVKLGCSSSPCRVQIVLPGHPETIDFLVDLKTQ